MPRVRLTENNAGRTARALFAFLMLSSAAVIGQPTAPDPLTTAPCHIRTRVTGGLHAYNTWTDGVIPYKFASDIGSQNRTRTRDAMDEIESVCAILFVPRTSEQDYILITNDSGNSSWVGLQGGAQEVSVISWSERFVICHELMHAAGLWHEQQRYDRNTYVRINWGNIYPGFEHNFEIQTSNARVHGPYDFDSVMHYDQFAWSDNDLPTITVLPPNQEWQDRIGQRDHLSAGDASVLVDLYGNWRVRERVTPAGGAEQDRFGAGVALDRNTAIVGAPNHTVGTLYQGAAYVFERADGGWTEVELLTASDPGASDGFGCTVAMLGDTALIGARGDDDLGYNAGAVYVFDRVGGAWAETDKLTASDGDWGGGFGSVLAMGEDLAVIGAPSAGPTGGAYVFERIGGAWTEVAKLSAPHPSRNTDFGRAVACAPSTILVGSGGRDDQGAETGTAYVYERLQGVWTLSAELLSDDRASGDQFGYSVGLDDDQALIGAPSHNHDFFRAGSVYAFERTQGVWAQTGELQGGAPADDDGFGTRVAIQTGTVLVGAQWEDSSAGAVYVFEADAGQWVQRSRLTAANRQTTAEFGGALALDDGQAMIGASNESVTGSGSGAAYLCARAGFDPDACIADFNADGLIDTRDFIAYLNAWAQHDPAADWDGNGVLDTRDLIAFLGDWAAGC